MFCNILLNSRTFYTTFWSQEWLIFQWISENAIVWNLNPSPCWLFQISLSTIKVCKTRGFQTAQRKRTETTFIILFWYVVTTFILNTSLAIVNMLRVITFTQELSSFSSQRGKQKKEILLSNSLHVVCCLSTTVYTK